MSLFKQKGEQYKAKIKLGSLDEEYLNKDELAAARKAIMKYNLRDPGPSVYAKKNKKIKKKKK
jgi:hypothetical protein